MSKWQTSSSLPVAATGGMDFMRLALVVYDPDGVIDRPTWSQEHYWTEDVLYTLVWAGQGWMWNRDWGPYALAAIDTVGEESPIRKNADCYVELSEEEAGNPRQALSKIHRVLSRHPLVAVPWPVLVDRSWKLEPKKTAVSCGRKKISYEEFVGYGGIVQGYCLERAGPGEHVMVTFSDTPESRLTWAVVMYALSASGVPFSIMDRRTLPNAPARERLLERWQPRLWICCDPEGHGKGEGGMADIPARVNVELDLTEKTVVVDGQATRVRFPPRAPEILATAESVCFVDWTSGSTSGLPKGVETTHRTLINMMLWAWGDEKMFFHGGAKHEVVAANLFLLWYWWQPICVGASAVLVEDKELSDLEVHIALLDDEKVSIVDCITPSLLGAMVDYAAAGETEKSLPRTMVVSGEPLSEQVCRKFLKSQPKGARLVNLFSTTETGDAAYCPITEEQLPLWTGMVTFAPIGTPIWNVKLHIEDIKDDSGASGEGELFVEHAGGIMSYVNDAEQTARGFSSHHGWRSRDRVKEIQGVGLVIVGRADDNVKGLDSPSVWAEANGIVSQIRGFKVDLRLVEARCRDLSGLSEVCVMVDEEALVVAYTSPNAEVKPNELIDFCWREVREGRLPDSHVPQRALLWQGGSFPMMKTGKIDKTKVKEKVQAVRRGPSRARSGDMGSGSLIQARVAAVWRDTLGCECDLDGSFWRECGGQSLTAMRIAAALRIPAKLILDGTLDTPRDIIYFLTRSQHSSPREVHVAKGERGMAEKDHRIAVIGASGRWPGIGQTSLSALLEALSGKLVEFNPFVAPPDGHTGAGNVPGGYYLESALVSGFDEAFWSQRGVSDATLIDPHQRIWLEMAYESLLDGGFGPVMERGEAINCGVSPLGAA
ncbi:hypothetical protein FOL47_003328 [Perkinsus chesapeaki]|uniref:AMP-dependent synthetase/ligase domain-containing protein n=1 Tax=Perkinsus chesapeaki TaxID=330153 RepID=A0A7J6M8W2_PERCH|nr:hypothetical protein FOL47_003328 [Perkinsus chesapeaki]